MYWSALELDSVCRHKCVSICQEIGIWGERKSTDLSLYYHRKHFWSQVVQWLCWKINLILRHWHWFWFFFFIYFLLPLPSWIHDKRSTERPFSSHTCIQRSPLVVYGGRGWEQVSWRCVISSPCSRWCRSEQLPGLPVMEKNHGFVVVNKHWSYTVSLVPSRG